MADLPRDVLIDILSRLPARPLGRFKSVCKSWFSLISCPDFIKLHHSRTISDPNTNHSRIYIESTWSCHSVDYESLSCYEGADDDADAIVSLENPLDKGVVYTLMGYCYGLVCFVCHQDCTLLWNPCTQQTRLIPDPSPRFVDAVSFYGLGYDSYIEDYKIIRATRSISSRLIIAEVFNLKSKSWRTTQGFDIDIDILDRIIGRFSNRALHWEGKRSNRHILLSFDTTDENFKEIPLPDFGDQEIVLSCLGEVKRCLSITSGGTDEIDVDIWVMKEYGVKNSWTKLIKLSWGAFGCDYVLRPVCITKEGDVVVDVDAWFLMKFNVAEQTSKYLKKVSTDWHNWFMFNECLVSPFG